MQGFNKYYPPDYFDGPQKGLNAFHGKHALGDRARKLDKGILVVRFELPFNVWCGGCKAHLGQGVRYNAEKKKVGQYYSTPIYSFRCKCHLCDHHFEIRTDPQNTRYVVHEGAKQQAQDWDPAENGQLVLDAQQQERDAFESLERGETQKKEARTAASKLEALAELNESRWSDPFTQSQKLRSKFRSEKKERTARANKATALRDRYGLGDHIGTAALETPAHPASRKAEDVEVARMLKSRRAVAATPSTRKRTAKEDLARRLRASSKQDPFATTIRPAGPNTRDIGIRTGT